MIEDLRRVVRPRVDVQFGGDARLHQPGREIDRLVQEQVLVADVDEGRGKSGAAGWSAAIGAALAGAEALVLEKEATIGGTTAKAGGRFGGEVASTWLWICNHPWMAELGLTDPRREAWASGTPKVRRLDTVA